MCACVCMHTMQDFDFCTLYGLLLVFCQPVLNRDTYLQVDLVVRVLSLEVILQSPARVENFAAQGTGEP